MSANEQTPAWIREWEERTPEQEQKHLQWLRGQMRHPDPGLPQKGQSAHDRVFGRIDCLQCANCCKGLPALVQKGDIQRISRHLGMPEKDFVLNYTRMDDDGDRVLRGAPCPFLGPDNACSIYEHRPRSCRQYPHTGNNQFVDNLMLHGQNIRWCPAVFHILEALNPPLSH